MNLWWPYVSLYSELCCKLMHMVPSAKGHPLQHNGIIKKQKNFATSTVVGWNGTKFCSRSASGSPQHAQRSSHAIAANISDDGLATYSLHSVHPLACIGLLLVFFFYELEILKKKKVVEE